MAWSGRINSPSGNYSYFYFQWQGVSQNIAGNTTTINWQWGLNISNSAYWGSNSVKSISGYINGGQAIGGQTWSNISGNGDHHLRTGSWAIGHEANGTKVFSMSSTGWLYGNGNKSNSGSWELPAIPRHATLTALSMDSGGVTAYDEGPMWLEFSNPAGTAVDAFLEAPNGSNRIYSSASGIGSRFNFPFTTPLIEEFQQASPNSNSFTVRIGIHDSLGGDNWDFRDRTYYIKNDTGQANPTFADFTYLDTNSTTTAITGNNQVLIQGKSTLRATVSVANKATANKFATMSAYEYTIGSISQTATWSNTVDVVRDIGVVSDASGQRDLSVRAIDSRSNSKTVTKNITILPYASPAFVPTLTVAYTNDYDNSSGLTVTADSTTIANISPMTLSGTDKNAVNASTGVKFDLSKGNNTSYTGTYVDVATTQTSGTGAITTTLATLASAILTKMNGLTADNTVQWFVKFQITDSLETQYYEVAIDIGRAIFRIGADGHLYHNEVAFYDTATITSSSTLSPVGSASLNTLYVTALAAGATISAPSGTPTNGNRLIIRIKDNGTARALTWNSIYRSGGVILPTTTVINKTMYIGLVYNSADSKWDCILSLGNY